MASLSLPKPPKFALNLNFPANCWTDGRNGVKMIDQQKLLENLKTIDCIYLSFWNKYGIQRLICNHGSTSNPLRFDKFNDTGKWKKWKTKIPKIIINCTTNVFRLSGTILYAIIVNLTIIFSVRSTYNLLKKK